MKRSEAGERLLARVVVGDEMQIRARDFDKVAEDFVVADAQALDSRPRALALLHLGQISSCRRAAARAVDPALRKSLRG